MKKILISIKNDDLIFSYYNKPTTNLNNTLIKTNIIGEDELIFSTEYISKNQKIMSIFLNDLIKESNINTVKIPLFELLEEIFDLLINVKNITKIHILEEKSLPFDLAEKMLDNKNLEHINCYSAAPYILELFDRNALEIETRAEVLFTSNFMEINNLTQYSKLFYKTNIRIEKEFNSDDYADFEAFCKINKYLKTIHMYLIDIHMIEKIVKILHNLRNKSIKILLHKNIENKELALSLKEFNREIKNKYNITLKLVYSDNYLKENLFSQILINFLKTSSLVVILIITAIFTSVMINNYLSTKKVESINEKIAEVIDGQDDINPTESETVEKRISNKFNALLEVNSETVGWLKVNNTNIDYPIVKATNNNKYLNLDYYEKKDYNGWIFMDTRNNIDDLDKNTIIYGHNRYYSGVIFGTLNNVTKKSWYTNEENLIITFDSLYEKMNWKIFSIYRIKKTSDYIENEFVSDDHFMSFLETIKNRSIHSFDTEVNKDSKILTLSTCLDNNSRLVVHAVLIK